MGPSPLRSATAASVGWSTGGRVRRGRGGFTLIEILVALALVGLMAALAVGWTARLSKSDLRATASNLGAAVRYLFDRASTTGKVHRLVIDFNTGKYWAEVSDDRFFLPRDRETDESRQKDVEQIAEEQKAAAEAKEREVTADPAATDQAALVDPSRYQVTEWKPKRPRFEAFQEHSFKPVQLKKIKIADLFTPRYAKPISTGQGYIYFFPLGQTEPAIIHVSDATGQTFFSLLVHPLNGRVKMVGGYVAPRVDEQFDDEGTQTSAP